MSKSFRQIGIKILNQIITVISLRAREKSLHAQILHVRLYFNKCQNGFIVVSVQYFLLQGLSWPILYDTSIDPALLYCHMFIQ